jgi:hypothetical protein
VLLRSRGSAPTSDPTNARSTSCSPESERLSRLAYGPDGAIDHAVGVGLNLEGRLREVMRVWSRAWRQSRCRHTVTVSACSTGVERVVCESCGHVSVHFLSDSDTYSEVDRSRFARPGERGANPARHTSPGRTLPNPVRPETRRSVAQ